MKLLFDENVSPKLPQMLANEYPGSVHIREVGLRGAEDRQNPARLYAEARLRRAWRDYPKRPAGLELGGELLDLEEVVRNKAVAAAACRQWFRVRLSGAGFVQASLNMS